MALFMTGCGVSQILPNHSAPHGMLLPDAAEFTAGNGCIETSIDSMLFGQSSLGQAAGFLGSFPTTLPQMGCCSQMRLTSSRGTPLVSGSSSATNVVITATHPAKSRNVPHCSHRRNGHNRERPKGSWDGV